MPVAGGAAQLLGDLLFAVHATWGRDGDILVSQSGGGGAEEVLFRLPAAGGTPTAVNAVKGARWPAFLPDGRRFLYTVVSRDSEAAGIFVGSLDSPDITRLSSIVSSAQYGDGHLFYVKDQNLVAQPFDPASLRLAGDPVTVFENLTFVVPSYRGSFSVAGATLVARGITGPPLRQLTWMNRSGDVIARLGEPGDLTGPDVSPNGRLVAFTRAAATGETRALWMLDLERTVFSDLGRPATSVRFSTDGARMAYASPDGIRVAPVGGGGETVLLPRSGLVFSGAVSDWSHDDALVAIQMGSFSHVLDVAAPAQSVLIGQHGRVALSPAGGWMAYRDGPIFVEPFTGQPSTGVGRMQVSAGQGQSPAWRQDGRELYYISDDNELMVTTVTPGPTLTLGTPTRLFTVPPGTSYDVSADGQRFLVALRMSEPVRRPSSVLLNWKALLAAKGPLP